MSLRTKVYFASDFHLGSFPYSSGKKREKNIVSWLDHIKHDAAALYLVGDIFDFWFEYRTVVPKGYIRFLGKLAELSDLGVKITLFKGNHDMWMFGYLTDELNAEIVSDHKYLTMGGKKLYIHHGDGLGPGDRRYKFLKKIFRSSVCQWLFARIHPNLGIAIARRWSKQSRISSGMEESFLGEDKEWLLLYANELLKKEHIDYFVFGHRHLAYDRPLNGNSRIVNLGEWIHDQSYAVWDGQTLKLQRWKSEK